jgi:hypothetical protein
VALTRRDRARTTASTIARGLRFTKRWGRLLARPSGWSLGARLAALTARWHAGGPITVPHYYDFGSDRRLVGDELFRPDAWDAIRTETHGPFSLPATRGDWERETDQWSQGQVRARAIDSWLRAHRIDSLASYGVGGASLELWLHRLSPERALAITEFAPATVAWLARVFAEADVHRHDLLADGPLDAELHLFSRIDPEFSDDVWQSILQRFFDRRILVAAEAVDLARARKAVWLKRTDPNATWAGWLRNPAALEALWKPTHRSAFLRFGDLDGWILEPRVD